MFDSPERLALGLLTGFVFGFVLQKGQVTKYAVIVKQFLFQDFTMLKVMLTAVVVGGLGVYALVAAGQATLHIKPLLLGGVLTGGLIFGVGMAILGYCPGTGVAAVAEGSRHAAVGVLGMLVGAAAYAEAYPLFKDSLLAWGDYGKISLPLATGISPWAYLALLVVGVVALFAGLEKWHRGAPALTSAMQAKAA
jgi:uncharacterized membrane protein YedE/YeeE